MKDYCDTCADTEAGTGGQDPLKNHKNMGFLSNTDPDPLKKSQSYQASVQCLANICTPAKRHLNGISLTGRSWPHKMVFGSFLPSSTKKIVKVGPPLAKLSGSVHVILCVLGFSIQGCTHPTYPLCL